MGRVSCSCNAQLCQPGAAGPCQQQAATARHLQRPMAAAFPAARALEDHPAQLDCSPSTACAIPGHRGVLLRHCCLPDAHMHSSVLCAQGTVSATQLATMAALLSGCGVASTTLYFFSRRYIGELSLLPGASPGLHDSSKVLISTLDFWGNRQVGPARMHCQSPPCVSGLIAS